MSETWLTPEAYERLKTELEGLETEGRAVIRARILEARELGDLRENAEYDQAKDDQGLMEARIRELTELLRNAHVGTPPEGADDAVGVGMKVRLRDQDGDESVYVYTSHENRLDGEDLMVLTPGSPLGEALRGAKVGQSVSYQAPGGGYTVEVVTVEPL